MRMGQSKAPRPRATTLPIRKTVEKEASDPGEQNTMDRWRD